MANPKKNSRSNGCRHHKIRNRTPERPTEGEVDQRYLDPVELATVRQKVTNLVANRAVEVVHRTLEHIERGNHQAMKYLFEMVGLFPATTPEQTQPEDSLAGTLLSYLGVPETPTNDEAAKRDRGIKLEADAVK